MRTNIDLADTLVSEAMKVTGLGTKKAVVEETLRRLVGAASPRPSPIWPGSAATRTPAQIILSGRSGPHLPPGFPHQDRGVGAGDRCVVRDGGG